MRTRLLPRTIFALAAVFAAISGIVTAILGVTTMLFFHHELERQLDQRIEIETHALLDHYRDHGFEELVKAVRSRDRRSGIGDIGYLAGVAERGRSTGYIVTDSKGRRRAGSFDAPMPPPGWSEFVHFRKRNGGIGEAQAMNSTLPDGGHLVVAADRGILHRMHMKIFRMFAIGYGALLLLEALVVIGFGRVVRRRILAIEASANAIISGDLNRRMPLDGSGGEFDRLSLVLNRMLDRIGALLDNLRQVSGDIAHDLRTPLYRIRARLERAEDALVHTPQRPVVTQAMQEMDDLLDLFAALLAISEIEGQSVRSRFVPLDLAEAVDEIVEAYKPAIEQAGMTIEVAAEPAELPGDRKLLQRAVANLLDNVLLHTRAGTRIRIAIERIDGKVRLLFADDGPGVPAEEHERVFRRLTRLDRSRSTPGHGLGMNMVAAIAAAHGGSARIVPGTSGLTVEMILG